MIEYHRLIIFIGLEMEQQNVSGAKRPLMEVQAMYDTAEGNFEWEEFRYEVPRKYTHAPTSSAKSGALFGTKSSFLELLQKQKRGIPGPSHYQPADLKPRPLSGKMDRGKRLNLNEKSGKENAPGPGAYFKRPQSANICRPSSAKEKALIERPHYLNEVEFLAGHSPGVGTYSLTELGHVGVPKLFKKVHGDTSTKKDPRKLLNVTANCYGTFEWLKLQQRKKDSCSFGRSKRFDGFSKRDKKPAPNTYKFDTNWVSKTCSMNLTSSASVKSVYYH
jgi:hypothetical protein